MVAVDSGTPTQGSGSAHTWALALCVLVLGAVILGLSISMLPVRVGDAFFFMPPVVNYSMGDGLRNHGYLEADHTGAGRMVWHGYLLAMLYGSLLWDSTYRALFLVQGLAAIATVLLTSVLFSQVIRRSTLPIISVLSAILMLVGLVPQLLWGRPEPLASLILVLALVLLNRVPPRYHPILLGVGLMLVGMTTPAGAVLAALLIGALFSYNYRFPAAAAKFAGTMAIAAIGIAVVTQFVYPFGLLEWIRGMQHHATHVLSDWGYGVAPLIRYWFLNPTVFMYGVWLLTALACALLLMYRYWSHIKCPIGLIAFGLTFLWVGGRFAVSVPARQYNLFSFAPLACLLVLAVIAGPEKKATTNNRWLRLLPKVAFLLLVGLPALGTVRLVLHCAISRQDGLGYDDARQLVDEIRRNSARITLSRDLFVLAEDQHGIEYFDVARWRRGESKPFASDLLILQQSKLATTDPPILDGYELESDYFSHHTYRVFGLPVGTTPEAYNLAVYRKVARNAAQ